LFRRLLEDGTQWGLQFSYAEQDQPRGLADAFRVGAGFVGDQPSCLILGDNIFFGHNLPTILQRAASLTEGALVFAYPVRDPERYGVIEFDEQQRVLSIVEKPRQPRSNYAIPGIYFYDGRAVEFAAGLQPSPRGEIEITDLNRCYLDQGQLRVEVLGRGYAWLDAGTHESLLQASTFIQAVEDRQGMMISCPEEIAFRRGYIDRQQLGQLAGKMSGNSYGQYLERVAREERW
jgi:glucose-1-phosphate thymidylyltransferase